MKVAKPSRLHKENIANFENAVIELHGYLLRPDLHLQFVPVEEYLQDRLRHSPFYTSKAIFNGKSHRRFVSTTLYFAHDSLSIY